MKSIELNGFALDQCHARGDQHHRRVPLRRRRRALVRQYQSRSDTSVNTTPYQIVIGEPSTPLKVQPSIYLNNVTNLVFQQHDAIDSADHAAHDAVGRILDQRSRPQFRHHPSTQPKIAAGLEVEFTPIGTTGRTSVQATAIDKLNVHGSAKNLTVSRSPVPFSSENSGLNYLHKATFGGNADGVGIDVKGKIGKLTFKRGLGNPTGVFTGKASNGLLLPTTIYGTPKARPAIRPPASWAARSVPRASRSSTSGRLMCWCRRRRTRVSSSSRSRDSRLTSPAPATRSPTWSSRRRGRSASQYRWDSAQQRDQDRL